MTSGNTAVAVMKAVQVGDRLPTPTGRGVFEIAEITDIGVTVLLGERQTPTHVPWSILDEALRQMSGRGWVPIGAIHASDSPRGSFEELLKPALHRSTANYIAVLLERAALLEIDRVRPARVRVRTA